MFGKQLAFLAGKDIDIIERMNKNPDHNQAPVYFNKVQDPVIEAEKMKKKMLELEMIQKMNKNTLLVEDADI